MGSYEVESLVCLQVVDLMGSSMAYLMAASLGKQKDILLAVLKASRTVSL